MQQQKKTETEELKQCVYVPWYKFKKCETKTCKNYTEVIDCRCLAVDRRQPEGTKVISDEEIRFYKFNKNISTRLVSMKRKSAVHGVKSVLVLRELIEHIKSTFGNFEGQAAVFKHKLLFELEINFPLKAPQLQFENWMWEYLVDETVYKNFIQTKTGDCKDVSIADMLRLDEPRWIQFKEELKDIFF